MKRFVKLLLTAWVVVVHVLDSLHTVRGKADFLVFHARLSCANEFIYYTIFLSFFSLTFSLSLFLLLCWSGSCIL